jgi:SAM-dependent methyltransferase
MSRLSEALLYRLAKRFYRTPVAHSNEMKEALKTKTGLDTYRASQVGKVIKAAERYGVPIAGRDVLDLGCNDGALSVQYPEYGARHVIGVDIDAPAVEAAKKLHPHPAVEYRVASVNGLPVADESIDAILCYDVFEHVSRPGVVLAECRRVLQPGGKMLIGTWGWYHPFAPHLWSTLAVPWAHVFFSERTMLRTCRRVYHSPWYVPTLHDFDEAGRLKPDKYLEESISTDYLNKYLINDFEAVFAKSGLTWKVNLEPFGSKYARFTKAFLRVPYVREFIAGYLWAVLQKK